MNRRDALFSLVGGLSATVFTVRGRVFAEPRRVLGATMRGKSRLGVCIYCLGLRNKAERARDASSDPADPMAFLEYCHRLGAGGIQVPIGVKAPTYTAALRQRAKRYDMFVEGIMGLPRDRADVERFGAEIRTARRAGVDTVRVVIIPGRRYERFASIEEFRQFAQRGLRSLELAEPIAAREGVRLAVENHKDQRIPERLDVLKKISSRYVGACVDTGNSFALLEDPIEVVEAYAPWAFCVHLKDQAACEYEDGFLFADAALGEGFLNLKKMVEVLRKANPKIRFSLETITRDPLRVPCLTEKYWSTMGNAAGRDLARTLRTVRANGDKQLPRIGHLPLSQQVRLEEENVKKSLAYFRDRLG